MGLRMWDIVCFMPSQMALLLRKGKQDYIFSFPWKTPYPCPASDISSRPEMINVPTDLLFSNLVTRAKVHAFARASHLARASANGQVAKNLESLQTGALKFAYRRLKMKQINASDFLDHLRCCAIIQAIPDSYWTALSSHMSPQRLERLQATMKLLEVFHQPESKWLEEATPYLSRVLWSQDAFEVIFMASSQLAICYPYCESKHALVEISQRAQSLMKAREFEQTEGSVKPWQRTSTMMKKSIRIGPKSSIGKKDAKKDSGEGDEEKQ